jgi:hypothetical protein
MAEPGREAACAAAYKRFPALTGVRPTVQFVGPNRVFVFDGQVPGGPAGRTMRQVVRVTVDAGGKVVKVAVSR